MRIFLLIWAKGVRCMDNTVMSLASATGLEWILETTCLWEANGD